MVLRLALTAVVIGAPAGGYWPGADGLSHGATVPVPPARAIFSPPVLVGPATLNGVVCNCNFSCDGNGCGGAAPVCTRGRNTSAWMNVSDWATCENGASNFGALEPGVFFGFNGRDTVFSDDAGESWRAVSAPPADAFGSGPGAGVHGWPIMIPGPAPGQLHSIGVLEAVVPDAEGDADGASEGGGTPGPDRVGTKTLRSSSCTVFYSTPAPTNGAPPGRRELRWRKLDRGVTFRGAPVTSACAPQSGNIGHVSEFGLRMTTGGVATLTNGSFYAVVVGCIGAAPGQPASAASLVGFSSDDGFDWVYAGPVLPAAAFPSTVIGPTEHAVVALSSFPMPKTKTTTSGSSRAHAPPPPPLSPPRMLVVGRADGDGWCTNSTPKGSRYYEYLQTQYTDQAWSAPVFAAGAGCVRPRLLQLRSGPVLLTGGRECFSNRSDVALWINTAAAAPSGWQQYSLSYQHNRLWQGDPQLRYQPDGVNASYAPNGPFLETISYTSVMPVDDETAVITYGLRLPQHGGLSTVQFTFAMRVRVPSSDV